MVMEQLTEGVKSSILLFKQTESAEDAVVSATVF
jgi:hypothetical protein